MPILALTFLIGDLICQKLPLLSLFAIAALIVASITLFFLLPCRRYTCIALAGILGFAWSALYTISILSWTLPDSWEEKPIAVTGLITSIPIITNRKALFEFKMEEALFEKEKDNPSSLIKLTWQNPLQALKVGDEWQFQVKLKHIHGLHNPGSFNIESWALQNGLRASGYVLNDVPPRFIRHHKHKSLINQFRQVLLNKITKNLPHSETSPWLIALIIGERINIPHSQWQILRHTGTNHLMAIAGLHIGIIAGLAHMAVNWLWRRSYKLMLLLPAQHASAVGAVLLAIIYSTLAGFSLPTQRACFMLIIFSSALLLKQKINSWTVWSLALLGVLLVNPLNVLTESFWLSFGTIALIIYGMSSRLSNKGMWWKWGRVQWVLGVGLLPLTLSLFQEWSLISFVANTIAIPFLSFLILPFCFLSSIFLFICPTLGRIFLLIADKNLSILWMFLTYLSQLSFSIWYQAIPNNVILISILVAMLIILIPAGMPGRWLGFIWLLPLFFYSPQKPEPGEYWLTLLDVGQGLSVVIQTNQHVLVYDAGPKYSDESDIGETVVVPYLRTLKINAIDKLIISHGDNDHMGGVDAVIHAFPINDIKTSVPQQLSNAFAQYCLAGESWQWDNVKFTFIYPDINHLGLGNNSSCVLRIDNGAQSVLLAGDIEKFAEEELLSSIYKNQLASTILVAPHHGSKTSALPEFVSAVHPKYVLYATGYRNRYHFPNKEVIASYQEIQTIQIDTSKNGAITLHAGKNVT